MKPEKLNISETPASLEQMLANIQWAKKWHISWIEWIKIGSIFYQEGSTEVISHNPDDPMEIAFIDHRQREIGAKLQNIKLLSTNELNDINWLTYSILLQIEKFDLIKELIPKTINFRAELSYLCAYGTSSELENSIFSIWPTLEYLKESKEQTLQIMKSYIANAIKIWITSISDWPLWPQRSSHLLTKLISWCDEDLYKIEKARYT